MMFGDYHRVKELFQSALERDANERAAFLAEACNGDGALRAEVESMIACHEEASSFIEAPAFDIAAELLANEEMESVEGRRIGPYKLIREIGRGGMGAVYLAVRDDDQYHKQVAVKLIKRGMDTDFIVQRFRNERQILANLDHPNIARLLDGGATEDGLPFFVMDYIEGKPIDVYCESNRLPTIERLKLFRSVCSAVHYAHQNLVIHRDIKPGNILITADGSPKLLDFGIAKLLNPELSAQTIDQTATVLRLMTPDYASPEQVKGARVTTASDVYSLGVLLYELLTGHRPYRLKDSSPDEIAQVICEKEPDKPSDSIGKIRRGRAELEANQKSEIRNPKSLRGDIDNIVLMAMRKEPQRRYSSVEQFSEDIRRHLEGLPVIARKDTFTYRASKFVRRNKVAVAAAAVVCLTLLAGIVATTREAKVAAGQAKLAAEQRDTGRIETVKAERIKSFLQDMLSYRNKGPDVKVVEVLDEAGRQIETELNDEPEVKAELHQTIGHTYVSLRLFDRAEHHLQAALKLRREIYGEQHLKVAETLASLGGVFLVKGDYATASSYYEKALAMQRALPGGDNVTLANITREYGAAQRFLGNEQTAIPLYREALDWFRKHYGDEHEMVATLYNDLAGLYREQGKLDDAIVNDERSLEIFRKLSSRSPSMAHTLQELAMALAEKGEYKQAETLGHEALDLRRQVFGENHPDVANSLHELGWLAFLKHDYVTAEAENRKALDIYRRFPGSIGTAGPLEDLARIRMLTGQPARAEPYLRESLTIWRGLLPKGNSMIAEGESLLGECLRMQKRYGEAEPLLIESYQNLKASRGEKHHLTLDALKRLVKLYEARGKPDLAARYRVSQ
jgi:serine/threonine-protein kinase